MNFKLTLSLLLCASLMACSKEEPKPDPQPEPQPEPTPEEEAPYTPGTPIFEDQFETFNTANWTKETHAAGWVNNELQSYSPDQVSVGKDGDKTVLVIKATRKGDTFVSGRINSKGKIKFGNGTLEASIRMPKTENGLWPAFWMMGDNSKNWPACGEIDIVEMGNADGIKARTSERHVNSAIHYGASADAHQQDWFADNFGKSLQDGKYHTYTLRRSGDKLQVLIDLVPFHTFDVSGNEYFQGDFYVLFNLAVGGDFTGILDPSKITALTSNGQSAAMYIDWIRIFDK
ncbi:MAG: glycoside hydrolase family 16 protein [Muribaculaceae bacterium]|nr:glycoside hydrolase family 16 protein [Muribaculaceae bacterium]